jgi:iron(III) transport system ATP-binding protein
MLNLRVEPARDAVAPVANAARRAPAAAAIDIRALEKRYGAHAAVGGVSIAVPPRAFLVLVGPSGCGKSTMLRMLAGLEEPTAGEISFHGQVVADGRRGIVRGPGERDAGLVFQSYALWPHMTVAGNVDWPLKVAKRPAADRRARVQQVLAMLGIAELADRYPSEISGGQQQRVAIARMIAPQPRILLFDEPLSNLDAKLRAEMRSELLRIHRATGATSVYVTHDQVEAMTTASHVAVMRDGAVEQFGAPDNLLDDPATAFVATFVDTPPGNLLPVVSQAGRLVCRGIPMAAAAGVPEGEAASLLHRPETLVPADCEGPRRVPVEFAEAAPMAGRVLVTGLWGDLRLTAVVERHPPLVLGERFFLELPAAPAAVFDHAGRRPG